MSATSPTEFARRTTLLAQRAERFKPTAVYDRDGDCIEFMATPDPFYAERVDDLVTVYYSQETGEVVGCLIKGASEICNNLERKMPGFKIEIQDGRVKLEHFFRARLWSSSRDPQAMPTLIYRKLIDVAEETEAETEELCLT